MQNRLWFYAGIVILVLLILSALLAPILAPHDPLRQNLDQDLISHSRENPLGTDKLGRDILSRTIFGARISLLVGCATVAVSLLIGLAVGSLSGCFGLFRRLGRPAIDASGRHFDGLPRHSSRYRSYCGLGARTGSRRTSALF